MIYSGAAKTGQSGVAVILDKEARKGFISYDAISDRILTVHLDTKPVKTTIIQVYAPSTNHSEEDIEDFYSQLQRIKDSIKSKNQIIIMGDFNAKVGQGASKEQGLGAHGIGKINESGEKLLGFCQANRMNILNTMFKNHIRRKWTWISPDKSTKNLIDYIIVSKDWFTSFLDCKVRPGADCDSDHRLLCAKMKMKGFRKSSTNSTPVRYDLDKLLQPEIKQQFYIETNNRFEILSKVVEENPPEELWQKMKLIYHETAEKILGKQKHKKTKPWISQETIDMADQKKASRKNKKTAEYDRLKREIKTQLKEDKAKWLEKECEQIDEFDRKNKSKDMFDKIKKVQRKEFHVKQVTVNNEAGQPIVDPDQIMKRWEQYGEKLFTTNTASAQRTKIDDFAKEPPPLIQEIESALKTLKAGKSPGLDNIPAELLKNSGENATKAIHTLCCSIWNTCQWPKDWKQQELVMLHKAGSMKECGNYRTIALISHTSKILLDIILRRLKAKVEFELADEQAGFRTGRGTGDMLCAIQVVIEKLNAIKKDQQDAYIIFIDYSKAFDNVDHDQLVQTLIKMGFPPHLVALIQSLYIDQNAKIRWNGSHTNPFNITKGVRQGCILSPNLFSVYTEQVMRDSDTDIQGIKIGGRKVSNLRYADDTALCAQSHQEASYLINKVNEVGKEKSLKLNVKKTKTFYIGKDYEPVQIDNEELERVEHFKYLGSTKTSDGFCTKDVNIRIAMGKARMVELSTIWNDRNISQKLKLKLLKCLIWTVITYGAEGWTLRQTDVKKIESAEMWLYRRLLRVKWDDKRTNKSILEELEVKRELVSIVMKRKLSFFGHAIRNENCTLMKDILQGSIESSRKQGRPRTNYHMNVKDWTGLRTSEIYNAARNRDEWRKVVRRAMRAANADDGRP